MTEHCTLCDLPTPASPVTATDVDGTFCCQGCLDVARAVDELADVEPADVRDQREAESSESDHDGPTDEAFLHIDGMHCATCEAFVGLLGERTAGVTAVEASYATDTARIQYDPTDIDRSALPEALSGYGYTARFASEVPTAERDVATRQRLLVGVVLGMFVMPWYLFFLYPSYLGIETGILSADMTTSVGLYLPMAFIAIFTTGVVGYTGWPILRGAYVSLRTGRPNMDLLIAVAVLAAYAYSTVALLSGSTHLYYDVAIAIVLVVTAGGYYERSLKRAATDRLTELTVDRVDEATRRRPDGGTETVPIEDLTAGDRVVVSPGERVPVDGRVVEGTAAVDEAIVSGESIPTTKRPDDEVVGGSVVTDSALVIEVSDGAESTLDRITSLLWTVQSDRSGVQRFADRLASIFVPAVLVLGIGVGAWQIVNGAATAAAVLAALTVLVAACPCAMGLATPLAVAGGLRDALRRGIVVTTSTLFESAPSVGTVVFDKTGTLTTGEMTVRSVTGDRSVLPAVATLETRSSHPVAAAIEQYVAAATDGGHPQPQSITQERVAAFERHPGEGVSGIVDGRHLVVGTPELVSSDCGPLPNHLTEAVSAARDAGELAVAVGCDGDPAAVIRVGDRRRPEWDEVLADFEDRRVVVLTGDEPAATTWLRDHPAVDDVFAGVPPDGKLATIRSLAEDGPVAMIGDGTNDAPALSAADVGIAIGGTAQSAEAADVIILDGDLTDVGAVFRLARETRRRIRENIGWALGYNAIAIPLAAAGVLNPLLAAVAMATSSVLVVTNSRRRLLD